MLPTQTVLIDLLVGTLISKILFNFSAIARNVITLRLLCCDLFFRVEDLVRFRRDDSWCKRPSPASDGRPSGQWHSSVVALLVRYYLWRDSGASWPRSLIQPVAHRTASSTSDFTPTIKTVMGPDDLATLPPGKSALAPANGYL